MEKLKRIGLFGGTFDPIHFGHLNLAVEILEAHHLDEVWFCPAKENPHKMGRATIPVKARLEMTALGIEGFSHFKVIDVEASRSSPSYTIDTLELLVSQHKECEFGLILGEDCVKDFPRWHRYKDILTIASLYIGSRKTGLFEINGLDPILIEKIRKGITPTKNIEISATDIRKRLSEGLTCRHLVPAKVVDYILAHQLYL